MNESARSSSTNEFSFPYRSKVSTRLNSNGLDRRAARRMDAAVDLEQ